MAKEYILESGEYAPSTSWIGNAFAGRDFNGHSLRDELFTAQRSVIPELAEKDNRRKAYYQFFTDMKWGDATHYTVSLDSAKLGIDKCVEIIANLYK